MEIRDFFFENSWTDCVEGKTNVNEKDSGRGVGKYSRKERKDWKEKPQGTMMQI